MLLYPFHFYLIWYHRINLIRSLSPYSHISSPSVNLSIGWHTHTIFISTHSEDTYPRDCRIGTIDIIIKHVVVVVVSLSSKLGWLDIAPSIDLISFVVARVKQLRRYLASSDIAAGFVLGKIKLYPGYNHVRQRGPQAISSAAAVVAVAEAMLTGAALNNNLYTELARQWAG